MGAESAPQDEAGNEGEIPGQSPPGGELPVDARIASLTAELEQTRIALAESQDQHLRARAETENVRRRSQEDVAKAHKFAIEGFAEALVPVWDSLEKAVADTGSTPEALREGVEITLRQLKAAFERGRMKEINPLAEKFDPHRHQAISAIPGDGSIAPNHVAAVLQKGWMISDRVLRPALVTVVQAN